MNGLFIEGRQLVRCRQVVMINLPSETEDQNRLAQRLARYAQPRRRRSGLFQVLNCFQNSASHAISGAVMAVATKVYV